MDAKLGVHAEELRQTAERLARVGLVFDRACLSPAQRRVIFALQRLATDATPQPESNRAPMGFGYPSGPGRS